MTTPTKDQVIAAVEARPWPRHVEPDDVGGLGGKCGIIALAPGFPPGKVDLVRPRLRRQHLEGVAGMWRFTAATST